MVPLIVLIFCALNHPVECRVWAILVVPKWEWWPLLFWLEVAHLQLGLPHACLCPRFSGYFEPGKNKAWTWCTFLIDRTRTCTQAY